MTRRHVHSAAADRRDAADMRQMRAATTNCAGRASARHAETVREA
jgi:hypothetical protein